MTAAPVEHVLAEREYLTVGIGELTPFTGNPRLGRVDEIMESLQKHGQYKPVTVNKGTSTGRPMEVLTGNHTLLAAQRLGWTDLDITLIDVDDLTARSIVAADNRLADLGSYDHDLLAALLIGLDTLEGTGYTQGDLDLMFPPEPDAPADFPVYDDDISTAYRCPKCSYEWSGQPK